MFKNPPCPRCERETVRMAGGNVDGAPSDRWVRVCWRCNIRCVIAPGEKWVPLRKPRAIAERESLSTK